MKIQIKKKNNLQAQQRTDNLQEITSNQVRQVSGTQEFYNRDPIYHVSEMFQKQFDLNGKKLTDALTVQKETTAENAVMQQSDNIIGQTSMNDFLKQGEGKAKLNKFAQVAFNRGTLASGIIQGTGQQMMITCLKRTVGQYQPTNQRQRKLFEGSVEKNVEGNPNKVYFNRKTTDSAVGLVADVTRDARRIVQTMTQLAQGDNVLCEDSGTKTLNTVYSFLSDKKEKKLIQDYDEALLRCNNQLERSVITRAKNKADSLVKRKQYMKNQFIFKLREMGDNAQGMAAAFDSDEFRQAAFCVVNGVQIEGALDDAADLENEDNNEE